MFTASSLPGSLCAWRTSALVKLRESQVQGEEAMFGQILDLATFAVPIRNLNGVID